MASITFTIDDGADMAEFKSGFLAKCPVPLDRNGNPIMSETAWIKEVGKQFYVRTYERGKKRTAAEAAGIMSNLIY